ncbi:nitrate- and nitrite sensing domain-containing protein [Sinosporangium siamense]
MRTKVTAMLVSLAALWVFAAWVTLRDGMNILWIATLNSSVADPGSALVVELQRERRLALIQVGAPSAQNRSALELQQARTDTLATEYRTSIDTSSVELAASAQLTERMQESLKHLDGLASMRSIAKGGGAGSSERLLKSYTDIIDAFFRVYESVGALDDDDIARDAATLIEMSRAKELLAQEDALVAGFLAAGRFGNAERTLYAQLVGAQQFHVSRAAADLPDFDRNEYTTLVKGALFTRFRALQNNLLQSDVHSTTPPITAEQWNTAAPAVLNELEKLVDTGGNRLLDRTQPVVVGIFVRLALAGGLGLFAVIASVVLSITTTRALVAQLSKLRTSAWELANERLPGVVSRLGHGEEVDVETEAPPLAFGTDEIGQVGEAFNAVQRTAIEVAVEQAELRRSIRDILLSLARRTQSLVHRQLTLLDAMERRETNATELKDLFRVDHLATRMRRNAENLIVLSGSSPGRAWRRPVPMVDVVRGALAEVEDYTRVTVLPMGDARLVGRAVGDVIHLLAELVENAAAFSPPYTMVQVSGQRVSNGYAIEVEDRGLGMSPEDLAEANERIADPPEFNLSSTARLGLYVVSRLAERHHVRVSLKDSPYGGTTAVILLPHEIVLEDDESVEEDTSDGPDALPSGDTGYDGPLVRIASVNSAVPPQEPVRRPTLTAVPEPRDSGPFGGGRHAGPPSDRTESHGRRKAPPPAQRESPPPVTEFTPSGLPFRVPQASLAPRLRTDGPLTDDSSADDGDSERSPDEIRRLMGSFQTGTLRGRSDAAALLKPDTHPASEPNGSGTPHSGGPVPPPSEDGSTT